MKKLVVLLAAVALAFMVRVPMAGATPVMTLTLSSDGHTWSSGPVSGTGIVFDSTADGSVGDWGNGGINAPLQITAGSANLFPSLDMSDLSEFADTDNSLLNDVLTITLDVSGYTPAESGYSTTSLNGNIGQGIADVSIDTLVNSQSIIGGPLTETVNATTNPIIDLFGSGAANFTNPTSNNMELIATITPKTSTVQTSWDDKVKVPEPATFLLLGIGLLALGLISFRKKALNS